MVQKTPSVVNGVPVRARRLRPSLTALRRIGIRRKDSTSTERASTTSRADQIEKLWILSIVGYSVLRFVIAWGAFGDHGVNVWIFGFVDIATAWPYAKGVALVCRRAAAFEWRRLPMPIAVALASFFAPYAYIWFAAGSMPSSVRLGLVICVSVLAIAATAGVIAKVRKLRAAPVIDITSDARSDDEDTEVVVDLTAAEPRVYTRSRIAS